MDHDGAHATRTVARTGGDLRSMARVPEGRFLGSLLAFRDDRLALLRRALDTGAPLARVSLGPIPVVLVNDPDLAHEVLTARAADFVKFQVAGMPASRRLLGSGVLQSDGEEHRRKRRRLMPAFVPARVATYARVMAEETERQVAAWKDGEVVALDEEMERLTLAIFGRTLFGVDLRGEARALGESITTAIETVVAEAARFVHLPLAWPSGEHRRFARALAHLEGTLDDLIASRRAHDPGHGDLLSLLVRLSGEDGAMTDAEVREELLNLVVAGYEATATSLGWALHLLASDPARAALVHDEARAALAGRSPTRDDLAQMPRALAAFKEAMRLYPAAHIIVRQTARAVSLAGHALPAGVAVFVNGYAVHRRPDCWPDGEAFVPERFDALAPEAARRAYFPFGTGPRTCIGNHFAQLEGHVVVATVAQRVSLSLEGPRDPATTTAFAIRARDRLRARVHRA